MQSELIIYMLKGAIENYYYITIIIIIIIIIIITLSL